MLQYYSGFSSAEHKETSVSSSTDPTSHALLLAVYFVTLCCHSQHPSPKAVVFWFQLWHLGEWFGTAYIYLVELSFILVKKKRAGETYKPNDGQDSEDT